MDGLEHLGTGWAIVRRDLVAWVVLVVAWLLTVACCGLGLLLSINLVRAAARAIEQSAPPSVGDLFDTADLVDDLLLLVLTVLAVVVGQILPIVGLVLVSTLLSWAPMLLVDGHYRPLEAVIVSARAVIAAPARPLLFTFACFVLLVASSVLCFVPSLVAVPVVIAASWTFYEAERAGILAVGDAGGARRR